MDGRFLLLVLGFAPCPVLPFAREKESPSVSVSYRPRSDARYEGSRRPFVSIPPSVLELRLVNQSINQSLSCQSLRMLAILARQVPRSHSCEIIQSTPSRQSGMVQPVINEMFATVHAAGSSLLGLFSSCTTFDSTQFPQHKNKHTSQARALQS
eukprot:scaffold10288_cov154-Isochrysis_galbana.AAC.2